MNKFYALIISLFLISTTGCVYFTSIPAEEQKDTGFVPVVGYESLHFFSSGKDGLSKPLRVYSDSFGINSADWIWYELIIKNDSESDGKILFGEVWSDGNGNVISRTDKEMVLRTKDDFLEYTAGIKTDWKKGYYELNLFVDSLKIAGKEFQIVN
ncbi:MAG: hypothetical protein JXN63_09065 [Candidatus Delongbacteria bacterium]|nr:hypothetical protein [Candidatus Delongbacteria bacterium]